MLAAIGVLVGVEIGAATGPATHAAALPGRAVTSAPTTCFVAGSGCSLYPCHEFVASAAAARRQCDAYPRPRGRTLYIQR